MLETLKKKWAEYVLEIIVIIVGVLGAFALSSWNETRKSEKQALIVLEHISSNLEEDIDELELNQQHVQKTIRRADSMIVFFKTQSFDTKRMTVYVGWLNLEKTFQVNKTGMDALVNSGRLELLSPDLAFQLQQYYATCDKLRDRENISNVFIREKYEPYYYDNLISGLKLVDSYDVQEIYADDKRSVKYINETILRGNDTLEMLILIRLVHMQAEDKLYAQLIQQAKELQAEMKQQLVRR